MILTSFRSLMQQGEMITCVKRTRCWETDKHLGRMMTFRFFDCGDPLLIIDPDVPGVKTVQKGEKRLSGGNLPIEVVELEEVREAFVKVLSPQGIRWVKKENLCTPFVLTI